jgi:hypothetical protein
VAVRGKRGGIYPGSSNASLKEVDIYKASDKRQPQGRNIEVAHHSGYKEKGHDDIHTLT